MRARERIANQPLRFEPEQSLKSVSNIDIADNQRIELPVTTYQLKEATSNKNKIKGWASQRDNTLQTYSVKT